MAISVAQRISAGDAATAGSCTPAFAANVAAGNNIIAIGFTGGTAASMSTPTDTRGNTFNLLTTVTVGANNFIKVWIAYGTTAGADTVTMGDGFNDATLHIYEVAGLASSAAFDKTAAQQQVSATALDSTNTPTTTNANELLIGAFVNTDAGVLAWTLGTNYTNLTKTDITFCNSMTEERIVSATGAYNATASLPANTDNIVCAIFTFSDTAIATGPTVGTDPAFYKRKGMLEVPVHFRKPVIEVY